MSTDTPQTYWATQGTRTVVTDATGRTLGWLRTESTPEGPRWFAMRYDGAYATPSQGRQKHREAAEDFMEAMRRGEIE